MGVDLASKQDFTSVSIIDRNTHHLVYHERWQGEWNQTINRIIDLRRSYNNAHVTIDSTGVGDPISEILKRRGCPVDDFKFSNTSKDRLIKKLEAFFAQKNLSLPPEDQLPELYAELEAFTYLILPSGKIRYSAPPGKHDDQVYSLALAVWYLKEQPTTDQYATGSPNQSVQSLDPY